MNAPSRNDGISTRKCLSAETGESGEGRIGSDDVDVSRSAAQSMSRVFDEIVGDAGVVGASRAVAFARRVVAGEIQAARKSVIEEFSPSLFLIYCIVWLILTR